MQLTVAQDVTTLQSTLAALAREGKRIGLVPTMGALHAGHVALIGTVKQRCDAVIVSIFVNPKQFGPNEDFAKYPRMLEADLKLAEAGGASVVYTPTVEDMYTPDFATQVATGDIGKILCGAFRPGHFDGVATVVAKLLLRVLPHVAVFGEKDYQQLCVISRMVLDLDMPIEIIGMPTLREQDGLALSSRNAYLTPEQRKLAPALYQILLQTAKRIAEEGIEIASAQKDTVRLLTDLGFKVDYVELRESFTLKPLTDYKRPARLLAAAWLGQTRLIDNVPLE